MDIETSWHPWNKSYLIEKKKWPGATWPGMSERSSDKEKSKPMTSKYQLGHHIIKFPLAC